MFPFWKPVVAPIVKAVDARKVVEIGALRGETTKLMLGDLDPTAELHVIDPAPAFDPDEHRAAFGGRYVFHRDLSLNVLPHLDPMDVALIDGDHNWYTVFNELELLAMGAQRAGAPLPVVVLHDVCWPYGRRDLYYQPDTIPPEHRQEYQRKGMRRGRTTLVPGDGGLNPTLCNATTEGGEHNGVRTAIDDFVAAYDRPIRRVLLPVYFGLEILASQDQLDRHPQLVATLDDLESPDGKDRLLELAETIRTDSETFNQNVLYARQRQVQRAAGRYLALLRDSLLDEHYLEHEARIEYLVSCAEAGRPVDRHVVRDPGRYLQGKLADLRSDRRAGRVTGDAGDLRAYLPFTAMGRVRMDHLDAVLRAVREDAVDGDLVDVGVDGGGSSVYMRGFLDAHEVPGRTVWVADRFRAVADQTPGPAVDGLAALGRDLTQVREAFHRFDLLDDRVRFLIGPPAETVPTAPIDEVAVVRIGRSAGREAGVVLEGIYDRVSEGGHIIIDSDDPAAHAAVEAFRDRRGITTALVRIDWAARGWQKVAGDAEVADDERSTSPMSAVAAAGAPLAPHGPEVPKDLTAVVVFHDMAREARRTLHSLSRSYQQHCEEIDYEVLVIDNGSSPEQRLTDDFVSGFGPEFRLLELPGDAHPSPVHALNHAIGLGGGRSFLLMIDGAHVLTPGVIRWGMEGLRRAHPTVVATQQWYVGPGQQGDVMRLGYDQAYEDGLFDRIDWPTDGYRLFDIGHFVGDRDWFDGLWESNAVFVPRSLLEQMGCFDASFRLPGGGYANLELFERLASAEDVELASILGEGSFHQLHGGTTTNQADAEERRTRVFGYGQEYQRLRGRPFRGPSKPVTYLGHLRPKGARRTRARRLSAEAFLGRDDGGIDGRPETPTPIPDDLRLSFIDAFWRSLAWTEATWLGHRVKRAPTDLFAVQELLARIRPDWVIETQTGNGGRAAYLASICRLLDHGHVISIGHQDSGKRPVDERITYVAERASTPAAAEAVREITGDRAKALVIIGAGGGSQRVVQEFELFSPFVPRGSYVIVEETIVNGHPVWPSHGSGPAEAVNRILQTRDDFAVDPDPERFGLTFNPGGFLKRISGRDG